MALDGLYDEPDPIRSSLVLARPRGLSRFNIYSGGKVKHGQYTC